MRLLFWTSAALAVYVYAGYPIALAAWAAVVSRRRARIRPCESNAEPPSLPGVSIVIAARNEADRLPARIRNLLELDYPADRRQIIVATDGIDQETVDALRPFADAVDVVAIPPGGKAAALNAGVAKARFDILAFADARQVFAVDALSALVAPFADPAVGGVSGELVLGCEGGGRRHTIDRRTDERDSCPDRRSDARSTVAEAVGAYWSYEKQLRRLESVVGSTLGATGAIYALRRSLWSPLPPGTILDDVLAPMRAVLAGRRVVFEPAARAFDRTAPDAAAEAKRKLRTLAGNLQILWLEPRLLVPFANPVWIQYVSHKVGRLLVPYALLGLMASSIALAQQHLVYALALGAQSTFYLLAGYGAWLEHTCPKQPIAAAAHHDVLQGGSSEQPAWPSHSPC